MGKRLLQVYHAMPYSGRSLLASLHGWRLSRWRYGPELNSLLAEARARESWSRSQWQALQQQKLEQLLKRAAETVPHYRALWGQEQAKDSGLTTINLRRWPVLSKAQLRGNPTAFLSDQAPRSELRIEQTSGTTGTPLKLWQNRTTVQEWYALTEARWRGWYGVSRHDRWAIFGGQLIVPTKQKRPPFWVWNSGLKQLYLSSYHLSPENCKFYLDALRRHRVVYLYGYASSLYSLALFVREQQLDPPPLKLILSNAEPLYSHQRELISRVFGCPVRDTYGTSEKVCAASECEAGRMHLWPEVAIYEVLQDDSEDPVEPGQVGRLVCTGLLNFDMPLVRYETGDRVALAPAGTLCACGRTLPILLSVEGRKDDVVLTPDGRRIGRLDPVFKCDLPVREAQVIQETLKLLRILVVPAPGFGPEHANALVAAMQQRVGAMDVQVESVREIPRSSNGKFRAVVSKVNGPS